VDQNGQTVRLKDLRGQPLLVFFYPKAGGIESVVRGFVAGLIAFPLFDRATSQDR